MSIFSRIVLLILIAFLGISLIATNAHGETNTVLDDIYSNTTNVNYVKIKTNFLVKTEVGEEKKVFRNKILTSIIKNKSIHIRDIKFGSDIFTKNKHKYKDRGDSCWKQEKFNKRSFGKEVERSYPVKNYLPNTDELKEINNFTYEFFFKNEGLNNYVTVLIDPRLKRINKIIIVSNDYSELIGMSQLSVKVEHKFIYPTKIKTPTPRNVCKNNR